MRAVLVAVVGIAVLSPIGPRAAAPDASGAGTAAKPTPPETGTTAKPTPPEARALSKALLTSQEWEQLLDRYSTNLSGQLTQSLQAQKQPVPSDLQANLRRELGQKLPYDHAVDAQAKALANHFSPDEMKQAATFYSSAVGKKVLSQLPQALSELGDELQGQLATTVPEIVARVAPKALGPDGGDSGTGSGGPSPDGSAPPEGRKQEK